MTVAEIGAGSGWLTVEVAQRVGPPGRVYATELTAARLDEIRQAAGEAGLRNVTVLEAGARATNLSAACCDAIFMRRVYHHLSDPSPILTSVHDALRSGGRLVIIEFRPDGLVGRVTRMGVDPAALIEAVAYLGTRPTFDDGEAALEVFLFDFDGDLYGREIEVEFAGFVRDDRKFDSPAALVHQMDEDVAKARGMLATKS